MRATAQEGPAGTPDSPPASPPEQGRPAGARQRAARLRFEEAQPAGDGGRRPAQHGTQYQQKFTGDAQTEAEGPGPAPEGEARRASKLEFTADELPPEPPGKRCV